MDGDIVGDKRKKKNRFRLRNIILLILALHIGKTFINQGILIRELKNKKMKKEQEISQIKEDIRELKEEIKAKGSLNFVEKVAREDLGMVKPKEIIYVDKNRNKSSFLRFRK
ncbi:MAG TPA: septum formation initiator family protein [Tepidimicrobium sp.]|nr:septum formation initiator family protein [Tepidimicrobium sp.]